MKEHRPIDEINLVYEDGVLVGWYRPGDDPEQTDAKAEIESLKAELEKLKADYETTIAQFEHVMAYPDNHCLFCAYRDADCPKDCNPKYMGAWCESCG